MRNIHVQCLYMLYINKIPADLLNLVGMTFNCTYVLLHLGLQTVICIEN